MSERRQEACLLLALVDPGKVDAVNSCDSQPGRLDFDAYRLPGRAPCTA